MNRFLFLESELNLGDLSLESLPKFSIIAFPENDGQANLEKFSIIWSTRPDLFFLHVFPSLVSTLDDVIECLKSREAFEKSWFYNIYSILEENRNRALLSIAQVETRENLHEALTLSILNTTIENLEKLFLSQFEEAPWNNFEQKKSEAIQSTEDKKMRSIMAKRLIRKTIEDFLDIEQK